MWRVCTVVAAAALSTTAASAESNRVPYDTAVRCFAASVYVQGLLTEAGNSTPGAAASLEKRAKEAWGVSFVLGKAVGLSEGQVKRDLEATKETQTPRFYRDTAYLKSTVAACKAMDLM